MELTEIIAIKQELKPNIRKGDYITLGEMLSTTPETARKRFERDNEESVLAVKIIISERIKMIASYRRLQNASLFLSKQSNKKNKNLAFLDTINTSSGRFAVVIKLGNTHYTKVYKSIAFGKKFGCEFIELVLKEHPELESIVLDSWFGKLPQVIETVSAFDLIQYPRHKRAHEIESLMSEVAAKY